MQEDLEGIRRYVRDGTLRIIVKPNASKTIFLGYDEGRDAVKIAVSAPPEDGKANDELLKYLRKKVGECTLVSGMTSRRKVVKLR